MNNEKAVKFVVKLIISFVFVIAAYWLGYFIVATAGIKAVAPETNGECMAIVIGADCFLMLTNISEHGFFFWKNKKE